MLDTNSVNFNRESLREIKRVFKKKLPSLRNFNDVMQRIRNYAWKDILTYMTQGGVSWHERMRIYRCLEPEEQLKFLSLLSPQFLKKFLEHLSYEENLELKARMEQRKII